MRSREVLKIGENLLHRFDGNDARFVAGLFIEYVTGINAYRHYIDDIEIDNTQKEEFLSLVMRRTSGEPIQYILGCVNFMGLNLLVGDGVFVPRPETEELVEIGIKDIEHIKGPVVYDIGTGSGAIGLAIAHFRKDAQVFMTDVSGEAIEFARKNAERMGFLERVKIIQSDLFNDLGKYPPADLVLSNPPYIPEDLIPNLPEDVRREPLIALNGGKNGTFIINRLLREAWIYLKPSGRMIIEVDGVNLDHLEIPEDVEKKIYRDSFGNQRFLKAWRRR